MLKLVVEKGRGGGLMLASREKTGSRQTLASRPMKSRKTKRQVVSEFRRAEIIDAARAVFASKGFSAASMDDVARQAGLAKGTLYLYFKSKLEVYRAVLKEDIDLLNEGTLQRMDAARTLHDKIRAVVSFRMEYCEQRRDFYRLLLAESGKLTAPPGHTMREVREWMRKPIMRVADAIQTAVDEGELKPADGKRIDPERISWSVADLTRGTIERRLLDDNRVPPEHDIDFIVEFIWSAIAGSCKAKR
jgi:AcrR family transcriptional regulator